MVGEVRSKKVQKWQKTESVAIFGDLTLCVCVCMHACIVCMYAVCIVCLCVCVHVLYHDACTVLYCDMYGVLYMYGMCVCVCVVCVHTHICACISYQPMYAHSQYNSSMGKWGSEVSESMNL